MEEKQTADELAGLEVADELAGLEVEDHESLVDFLAVTRRS